MKIFLNALLAALLLYPAQSEDNLSITEANKYSVTDVSLELKDNFYYLWDSSPKQDSLSHFYIDLFDAPPATELIRDNRADNTGALFVAVDATKDVEIDLIELINSAIDGVKSGLNPEFGITIRFEDIDKFTEWRKKQQETLAKLQEAAEALEEIRRYNNQQDE